MKYRLTLLCDPEELGYGNHIFNRIKRIQPYSTSRFEGLIIALVGIDLVEKIWKSVYLKSELISVPGMLDRTVGREE